MENVIKKELLDSILQLQAPEQEKVIRYINELIEDQEMEVRAEASEKAIKEGKVKTLDNFKQDFELWKAKKRGTIK